MKSQSKVIVIGNTGVGKSSLMHYLIHNIDGTKKHSPTIGAFFHSKTLMKEDKRVTFHIWDTAGQEKFRSIVSSYYRNSDICLLVFDVTDKQSFLSLETWEEEIKEVHIPNTFIIIANKSDLPQEDWKVSRDEITKYLERKNYYFVLTSAKNGDGVQRLTNILLESAQEIDPEIEIATPKKVSCC